MSVNNEIARPGANGMIISRPDFTTMDTTVMDWEPGPPGQWCKVLERDEHGYPCVFITYVPPGVGLTDEDLPFRHYHRSVYEHSFMLEGELPHWEYESAEQSNGEVYVKTAGVFMTRKPGSIHGIESGLRSRTGATLLYWRSPGGGTFVGEDNYEEESVDVPFGPDHREGEVNLVKPGENGLIFDRPDFTAIDTKLMDWEPGPPGAFNKILERDEDGVPSVFIAYIPPAAALDDMPELPFRHYHRSVYEHSFMLAGELPHYEYESAEQQEGTLIVKQRGVFMTRDPGSIHGLEAGVTSRVGTTILYWRSRGGGTWVGEENYEEESIHIPYG